ncbi:hypothetical protein LJR129_004964 [Acidovorax sp. LjRoot129]|uniref:hypothetical protein n=1 Tax=unclassified Acidovorax TaxID=2684926 RepID=UPI003ECC2FF6
MRRKYDSNSCDSEAAKLVVFDLLKRSGWSVGSAVDELVREFPGAAGGHRAHVSLRTATGNGLILCASVNQGADDAPMKQAAALEIPVAASITQLQESVSGFIRALLRAVGQLMAVELLSRNNNVFRAQKTCEE